MVTARPSVRRLSSFLGHGTLAAKTRKPQANWDELVTPPEAMSSPTLSPGASHSPKEVPSAISPAISDGTDLVLRLREGWGQEPVGPTLTSSCRRRNQEQQE